MIGVTSCCYLILVGYSESSPPQMEHTLDLELELNVRTVAGRFSLVLNYFFLLLTARVGPILPR